MTPQGGLCANLHTASLQGSPSAGVWTDKGKPITPISDNPQQRGRSPGHHDPLDRPAEDWTQQQLSELEKRVRVLGRGGGGDCERAP